MKWLKPEKANVVGTGLVYIAMFTGSIFKAGLLRGLLPITPKYIESLKNTPLPDGVSQPLLFTAVVISDAVQIFLIYTAVSYAISLPSRGTH